MMQGMKMKVRVGTIEAGDEFITILTRRQGLKPYDPDDAKHGVKVKISGIYRYLHPDVLVEVNRG